MELKTPTKKGIKTPRYRPPLPMLNESCSGFCIDEYDWPLFSGYYNGTSVIVDDSQDMTLLTNKGFFGKGSLSKGCPNLAKRKIPINVVYESQWKRRKMWIQSLNTLLESKKKSNEALEGNVVDIGNRGNNDEEKLDVDYVKNGSHKNNSYETSENECNENRQNESDETSQVNMVDIENKKSDEVVKKDIDSEKSNLLENNSCKIEYPSHNSGNEKCTKNANKTSQDNMADFENEKSNEVEKKEFDNEKNSSLGNNLCKNEEGLCETSMKEDTEEGQNYSNKTSQSNIVGIDNKKCNDVGKMEVDVEENNSCKIDEEPSETIGNEESKKNSNKTSLNNMADFENEKSSEVEKKEFDNDKNSSLGNNPCKNEEGLCETSMKEDREEIKKYSNETSQSNIVEIGKKKCNDVEKMEVDDEKNNSCKIEEGSSETSGNEGNIDSNVSHDTDIEMKQKINEVVGQKEISNSDKTEEIMDIPVRNTKHEYPNENKLKENDDNYGAMEKLTFSKDIGNHSKCVGKINLSNNKEKGTLNINEVLVIPDIDGDLEQYFLNLKPSIEEEKVKTAIEVLYLSLEEAFFLSYACNCLQIFDLSSNILQLKDMWILFQESQPDFIEKYVAYHYFRAKGWVVKSGTKFGGDFLLYKKGPLYFHASYIVIVEVLRNDKNSRNKTTWQKIVGMNRMAESANKEILICHILWPDVQQEKFNDPGILKEFAVSETLLRRWQATHEKTP